MVGYFIEVEVDVCKDCKDCIQRYNVVEVCDYVVGVVVCMVYVSLGQNDVGDVVCGEEEKEIEGKEYRCFEFDGFVLYGCDLRKDFNFSRYCDNYCGYYEVGLLCQGYVYGVYVVCLNDEVQSINCDDCLDYWQVVKDWFVCKGCDDV